jgi:hypothetical protein
VGFYDISGTVYNVAVSGSHAYVIGGVGLWVVDVSDPTAPEEAGFYDPLSTAYGVAVTGSHACVADASIGLRVVDVADPTAPVEMGFYDTLGYAHVADREGGLVILSFLPPRIYLPLLLR